MSYQAHHNYFLSPSDDMLGAAWSQQLSAWDHNEVDKVTQDTASLHIVDYQSEQAKETSQEQVAIEIGEEENIQEQGIGESKETKEVEETKEVWGETQEDIQEVAQENIALVQDLPFPWGSVYQVPQSHHYFVPSEDVEQH